MVAPLHHLQVGVEQGVVDGGGGLAHAAAHLVHRLAPGVDGGRLIAHGRRPAAGAAVERELVPGEQDSPVAGLGGQLHVELPVGGAGEDGAPLPQQVGEQLALQALLRLLGLLQLQGDGEGLPLAGGLIGGPQGLHVEVHPHHVVGDLEGLRIHLGALGLGVHLPVDLVKIGLLGGRLLGLELPLRLHIALLPLAQLALHGLVQGVQDGVQGVVPADADPGAALGHHQLVAVQLIGGGGGVLPQLLLHLVYQAVHRVGGHAPGGDPVLLPHQPGQVQPALGKEAVPAVLPSRLGRGAPVIVHLVGGDGAPPVPVGDGAGHLVPVLGHGLVQGGGRLLHCHAGHIHPAHHGVGKDGARAPHPGAQAHIGARQHPQDNPCGDGDLFPLSASGGLWFHALTFHIGSTSRRTRRRSYSHSCLL